MEHGSAILFRMPNGMTSKDVVRQSGGTGNKLGFYGRFWRFSSDKEEVERQKAIQTGGYVPKKNPDEILPRTQPGAQEPNQVSAAATGQAPVANASTQLPQVPGTNLQPPAPPVKTRKILPTAEELMSMDKPTVQAMASGLGIVNIEQDKDKLVDAILEKQAS